MVSLERKHAATLADSIADSLRTHSPAAWRVSLTDEGPGVPEADIERIFSRFVQLGERKGDENAGAGLGLAIARSILQLHGGTIHAENRTDRTGLRVTFEIPG